MKHTTNTKPKVSAEALTNTNSKGLAFTNSKGLAFRQALKAENPLQIMGVINAIAALLAQQAGFQSLYLSGAGVANACFGLPDLGMTSSTEVAEEIRRITDTVDLPLLVDADTGFGSLLNVARTVSSFEKAGASGLHLEDQSWPKRCGHRPGKKCISETEMCDRLKAALDARRDNQFVIMARTDAYAEEGLDKAIERACKYVEAGADMMFAEAFANLQDYETFVKAVKVPVLANITEFGKTPLFTTEELKSVGIEMVLYPLSAFRAMNQAALKVYTTIRKEGTQKAVLQTMQTREELYHLLDYYKYEDKI